MKILKLKFKNINSLAGEWEIDFTKPQFTDNGLFAITGKTGAGKSSILDAIALALYGKTPRVEITGQNNDVMSRGATDCYSEIVFEVGGKKWKSAWKQERTRTGNLKPVNRQIADSTDKIYADQALICNSKIVEILGLTFEQFTKVIMLAQGGFSAFLQADKNKKGELLEQITGTAIYGEISRKVFERNKTEKEKLDKILVEIGVIKILSEEEIENLNKEITEFNTQKNQIDSDLQIIEVAKKWLSDLENLQKQVVEAKQKLPDLEQTVEIAKRKSEQSEIVLKATKTEKENSDRILVQVRELDTKIAEKNKFLIPVLQMLSELEKTKNTFAISLENQNKNRIEIQNALQQKQAWAMANVKYESLVEQFAAIENQQLEVNNLSTDYNTKKLEFENAKKDLETKTAINKDALSILIRKEKALNEKEQELKTKRSDLSAILSGKEIDTYRKEKENITNFGIQIKDLIDVEKEITENKEEIEKFKAYIASFENLEKALSKKNLDNKTVGEYLKKQIDLLEANIKLIQAIQHLDERRKSLEDGKPCPLCGSTEHPYALGNEPKIGEKETELKNLKNQEQQIINTVQQDEKALTKLVADKTNAQINKEKAEKQLLEYNKKRDIIQDEIKILKPDFSISAGENKINFLENIQRQNLNEDKQVTLILSKAVESEKLIKTLQEKEIPQLQLEKQISEKAKTEAEMNRKLSEQHLENKTFLFENSGEKYKEKNVNLMKIFTKYDATNIDTLKKRLDDWNKNKTEIEDLKEQMNKLESALALTNVEIENIQKQLAGKTTEKQRFETEKQTLSAERYHLFGDKQVGEEEKRLKELLEKAETAKTNTEKSTMNASTELAKNQVLITEKEKELTIKRTEKITEKTFDALQAEYDEKKPQSDLFSQKTGANRQALHSNDENLQKNRIKLNEKELQQKICSRWGSLNELIGSQDGKKYRNFAQTLTFEYLIGLANRQLQKMSERYILKRAGDAANPFELSVIDKFQNCDERTTQNLSGGEKFIVSLALALGLANMASRNMKIDTMFIDEGFGTLDSDYLNVALTALSNLQSEGKLIGVISHLTELKERITTHIEVIPKGDGHSKLEIVY